MIKKASFSKNILLVDDDHSVTQMLSMLLGTKGFYVEVAPTGREALAQINSSFDLVLLDLVLPDQEGFEVCRKLKESQETQHIPIIILTGRILSENIVEGLYLGADDYLTKPFEYEELVARMEAVMRRSSVFKRGKVDQSGKSEIIKELKRIIKEESIVPFFQPIFNLKPFKLLGLEALCRPNTNTVLSNPDLLFKAALEFGMYHELEMLSWRKAIQQANQYLTSEKLFLNCNPYFVEGPKFLAVQSLFDRANFDVKNVVLEITERSAVSDYKIFYEHLQQYRDFGFQFAVDDVGGGYASLESIVETKPEVVKIDRHIVCSIDQDPFKKSIVRFIVSFCRENNILCIAEGIETEKELATVLELGVDAGQGYFLYKPTSQIDFQSINNVSEVIF